MKKILFGLLLVPSAANAQVPVYPQSQDAPRDIDPGTNAPPSGNPTMAPGPATPRTAPPPGQQKPNVIVVGPDGKVTYDPTQSQATPGGYYYVPDNPGASFGYEPGDEGALYAGPTPELHVVRTGDTLWDICSMYFNDPWQWPKIWSYNPQVTNPHWIYPGDLVRLLPRGMFAQQPESAPELGPDQSPAENLPPPAKRTTTDLKQTAFVEKTNLDQSITIDGSVDEKELLGPGDSVYLRYPDNNPPRIGQRYSIYKADNTVKSGGKEVGAFVRILGSLEVVSVKQDKRARGVIVEASQEIERGQKVGPLVKQYKNVTPVAPKVDAQGSIVAMLTKEQLIGEGEIVFVDLGASSGVEVGNRMFVVRRGDAMPPHSKSNVGQDDRRFPTRTLGQVVIVEVGQKISVGKVTVSVQEMGVGDLVMMQKSQ